MKTINDRWTRTRPTQPGPYFYRDEQHQGLVLVVREQEMSGSFLAVKWLHLVAMVEVRDLNGEWAELTLLEAETIKSELEQYIDCARKTK